MITWYLVRHGETEWNAEARMQGHLDSRLTPLGRLHADETGKLLARLGVDTVFASPLGRVRETLAIVQKYVPLPAVFDDRLKEWSSGDWSGELHAELAAKWPEEWAAWEADRYNYRSPGGENFVDLIDRARSFFGDLAPADGERIALIGHGFMNRALATVLLSLDESETMQIRQANDTVIRVVQQGERASADYFVDGDGPWPGLPDGIRQARESV